MTLIIREKHISASRCYQLSLVRAKGALRLLKSETALDFARATAVARSGIRRASRRFLNMPITGGGGGSTSVLVCYASAAENAESLMVGC